MSADQEIEYNTRKTGNSELGRDAKADEIVKPTSAALIVVVSSTSESGHAAKRRLHVQIEALVACRAKQHSQQREQSKSISTGSVAQNEREEACSASF